MRDGLLDVPNNLLAVEQGLPGYNVSDDTTMDMVDALAEMKTEVQEAAEVKIKDADEHPAATDQEVD